MGYNHYRFARRVGAVVEFNKGTDLGVVFDSYTGNYQFQYGKTNAFYIHAGSGLVSLITYGNSDFKIQTGTGKLRLGTPAAITTETLSHYIPIKDEAGNDIKLAVIS